MSTYDDSLYLSIAKAAISTAKRFRNSSLTANQIKAALVVFGDIRELLDSKPNISDEFALLLTAMRAREVYNPSLDPELDELREEQK